MQHHNNTEEGILQDRSSSGHERPWRDKKMRNTLLAMAYDVIDPKKALRLRSCADFLTYNILPNGKKTLKTANFCRVRLCPICTWRRSLKVFSQVENILSAVNEPMSYLLLTLTVRNCISTELSETLDKLILGFNLFSKYTDFKRAIKGWYRGVEVTHNLDDDTFHPHIHVLLAVKPSYFTDKRTYISQAKWGEMWQKATRNDYIPRIDIRKCTENTALAVAEVAKYAVKDSEYIVPDDWDLTLDTVRVLDKALNNRRFIAFGGLFKALHKQLNLDDTETGDLVHTDDKEVLKDDAPTITYFWAQGYNQYRSQ